MIWVFPELENCEPERDIFYRSAENAPFPWKTCSRPTRYVPSKTEESTVMGNVLISQTTKSLSIISVSDRFIERSLWGRIYPSSSILNRQEALSPKNFLWIHESGTNYCTWIGCQMSSRMVPDSVTVRFKRYTSFWKRCQSSRISPVFFGLRKVPNVWFSAYY